MFSKLGTIKWTKVRLGGESQENWKWRGSPFFAKNVQFVKTASCTSLSGFFLKENDCGINILVITVFVAGSQIMREMGELFTYFILITEDLTRQLRFCGKSCIQPAKNTSPRPSRLLRTISKEMPGRLSTETWSFHVLKVWKCRLPNVGVRKLF